MTQATDILSRHVPLLAGAGIPLLLQADESISAPVIVAVWIFVVGCIFGSFFNVVVYRLPLGLNLAHPPSRCPVCEHPIRWRDNLPVLGWLLLRGRCRDCNSPISARYPLVEATVGVLFAGLAWFEVLASTSSLPHRPDSLADVTGLEWGILAYHLWLLSTLLIATWIEYDGNRTPPRLLMLAIAVGLAAPIAWPGLRPMPLLAVSGAAPWLVGLAEGLAGLGAGVLMGCLAWPLTAMTGFWRRKPDSSAGLTAIVELALVGTFLGWQAVTQIPLYAAALAFIFLELAAASSQNVAQERANWHGSLTAVVLVYLGVWNISLVLHPEFAKANLRNLVIAGLSMASVSLVVWGINRYYMKNQPHPENRP